MYSKETNRVRCSFSCLEDLWCLRTPSTLNVSRPKPRLRLRQARDLTPAAGVDDRPKDTIIFVIAFVFIAVVIFVTEVVFVRF